MTRKEKTVPNTQNLDQLEQAAQEAISRAAEARAAAEQVRRRAEQARSAALAEHDEEVLRAYAEDRAQLDADLDAARRRLDEAVLADPVWCAYADYVLAGHRRTTRSLAAGQTAARLHGNAGFPPTPGVILPTWADVLQMVTRHAEEQGRAEAAAREQARIDAGQAAADREAGR